MAISSDARLRARALNDQGVAAALEADWPRAVEINQGILEGAPDDVEARNRLGRAFMELGKVDDARAAYEEALRIEPNNLIANRALGRLRALEEVGKKVVQTKTRTQARLFIEDMGKTGIVRLINTAPPSVLARYSPGAEVALEQQGELVAVHASDRALLGFLEPKVGRRLLEFLRAGNEYVAALVSLEEQNVRIAIRETFQHPSMAGKVPFPGSHRAVETRAYIRGTFFREGGEEEEPEGSEESDESEAASGGDEEGESEDRAAVLGEAGLSAEDVKEDEEEEEEE